VAAAVVPDRSTDRLGQAVHSAQQLLDRNGIVRWTYAEDTPKTRRENSELLERIRALP
jgi:hypothetical protein